MTSSPFLDALSGKLPAKLPVWFMRQAGRVLPQYRALRERYTFEQMLRDPGLVTDVTLQPVHHWGVDAAILFADILTLPEALGCSLRFVDGAGPVFDHPLQSAAQLRPFDADRLAHVDKAVRQIVASSPVPLIGFCGTPWTVALYVIEGRHGRDFLRARQLLRENPAEFERILERLTAASIEYLDLQVWAGAAALQIFDSWGGMLNEQEHRTWSLAWTHRIIEEMHARHPEVRIILYSRGTGAYLANLLDGCPADAVNPDWTVDLGRLRQAQGCPAALQGNFDPSLFHGSVEQLVRTVEGLAETAGPAGYIVNAGHGLHPGIDPGKVQAAVDAAHAVDLRRHASVAPAPAVPEVKTNKASDRGTWAEMDLDLIRRYDRQGPRYTSYPTAPQFKTPFNGQDLLSLIGQSQADAPPPGLSLYFHIPYCRRQCLYCGCNSSPLTGDDALDRYVAALVREAAMILPQAGRTRWVEQLHFGGGTPSLLQPAQMDAILAETARHVSFAGDAERGIELDPRTVSDGYLPFLRSRGFNRVSLGVQDLDPEVQRLIGRDQPPELTESVYWAARGAGFSSINVDLIYGLPGQTLAGSLRTADGIIALKPDRIALFNFAYVPHFKPHQRQLPLDRIPPIEEKLTMFLSMVDRFEQAGYLFIGLDHFARPDDEMAKAFTAGELNRTFQGYTARSGLEVLAFGASGISQLRYGFAQNEREPALYEQRIAAGELAVVRGLRMTGDDRVRQAVIEDIMCNQRVDICRIERRFGIAFEDYFRGYREVLGPMANDGLVQFTDSGFRVTRPGRLVLRNIAMTFDAYLSLGDASDTVYSRTI